MYNGENISNYNLQKWRQHIALVSQESFIFNGTIAENISYGSNNNNMNDIIKVAKNAGMHTFISQLDNGYNTLIGEGRLMLSGGKKQRISIARACLKNSPILILDEATSSVDNETERFIQKTINQLSKSKTIIIIAHRLSTTRQADWIHVMQKGE